MDLVNDQPDPRTFYSAFLELEGANMLSILSFDSRTMKYLLNEQFDDHFNSKFPLFYKNKIPKGKQLTRQELIDGQQSKFYYRSAIDNALRNNQISAVKLIINYCIQYQNNYTSSFLFLQNLPTIFEKGIDVIGLIDSDVFNYTFDFDQWPSVHTNHDRVLKPYHGSLFNLREEYSKIFKEPKYQAIQTEQTM